MVHGAHFFSVLSFTLSLSLSLLMFNLLQVFVETLDRCFENVCELDLIFHVDKVHNILQVCHINVYIVYDLLIEYTCSLMS